LFHHLTVFHHRNEVANLRGHPEIVRDEDDGKTKALRNPARSFKTCACTDTSSAETASSATQDLRTESQALGPGDALALATGEFVRDKRSMADGSSPTSANSSFAAAMAFAGGVPCTIGPWATRSPRLAARIKRRERILEHHLNMTGLATDVLSRHFCPVLSFKDNRPPVGSMSRTIQRASGRFPDPDSPTMPSVAPLGSF